MLYTGSYCGLLGDVWRINGSSGSDNKNRACLSSNVYGLS